MSALKASRRAATLGWVVTLATLLAVGSSCTSDELTDTSSGSGDEFTQALQSSVASLVITPDSATVAPNDTIRFAATGRLGDGGTAPVAVTWSASGGTIDSAGVYTAGDSNGVFQVVARQSGGTLTDTTNVTVTSARAISALTGTLHVGKYVSSGGSSSGTGSASSPWSLSYALSGAGGRIQAGDTVWLRGGTYYSSSSGFRSSLRGISGAPIVVRQYPGERAIIDGRAVSGGGGVLLVDGGWTEFWDFEVMNSSTVRDAQRPTGVYVRSTSNTKFINMVLHDGGGVYTDPYATNIEFNGMVIYNGGAQLSTRAWGHGMYLKSCTGPMIVRDNVTFNNFELGIHAYTNAGSGCLKNMTFEGNVSFNAGALSTYSASNVLIGGEVSASGITFRNNMTYFSPGFSARNVRLGYSTYGNGSATVEGNYIAGGATAFATEYWSTMRVATNTFIGPSRIVQFTESDRSGYTWSGNQHYRSATSYAWRYRSSDYTFSGWKSATGLGSTDQNMGSAPTSTKVFVRPNKYERGRANIVVYNWGKLGAVSVDLSNVLNVGDRYEVRNVQALFGSPVVSGTYGGGSISIPMTGVTPPAPIGGSPRAPVKTGPAFDVFIVRKPAV